MVDAASTILQKRNPLFFRGLRFCVGAHLLCPADGAAPAAATESPVTNRVAAPHLWLGAWAAVAVGYCGDHA